MWHARRDMDLFRSLIGFLRTLLVIALVVGGVFLAGREILLFSAEQQLLGDLNTAAKPSMIGKYGGGCAAAGGASGAQLRFLSSVEYSSDVRCQDGSTSVSIQTASLPMWVMKLPGSAGLIKNDPTVEGSNIRLQSFGRTRVIRVGSSASEVQVSPRAECAGYGHMCCNPKEAVSTSKDPSSPALDCPTECFLACNQRPQVLTFRSEPAMKQETRTVELSISEQPISFSYLVTDVDGSIQSVRVDFGDGTSQEMKKDRDVVNHTYACATGNCTYTARVVAIDNATTESYPATISTIKVVLTP